MVRWQWTARICTAWFCDGLDSEGLTQQEGQLRGGGDSLLYVTWDLKADTEDFISVKVSPKKHADVCKC